MSGSAGGAERNDNTGYLYILPAFVIICMFHLIPILYAFVLSMNKTGMREYFLGWNDFENYWVVLSSPRFWHSMKNTLFYVIGSVPLGIAASLTVAMLLNTKVRGMDWYRVLYFLPVITSLNAIAIVWKYIYQKDGVLNWFVGLTGFVGPGWLDDPNWAMIAIILMSVWKSLGYNTVIFLAGLQNIPNSLYDACEIDGANKWQTFWAVTWPILSPTTYFVLIMSTISSFQVFGQIYIMTQGGPLGATNVVIYEVFNKAYGQHQMGQAAAMSFILMTCILMFTFVQKKFAGEKVHYT